MNRVDLERWKVDDDLALVNDFTDRISSAPSVCEMLNDAVESAIAILYCDSCSIYLFEGNDLVQRASSCIYSAGLNSSNKRMSVDIRSIAQLSIPIVIGEQAYKDSHVRAFNKSSSSHCETFLSVPIFDGGQLAGVINAQSHARREYSDRDVNLLSTLGSLLGTEIKIRRLNDGNESLMQKLDSQEKIEQATKSLKDELGLRDTNVHRWFQKQSYQVSNSMSGTAAGAALNNRPKN